MTRYRVLLPHPVDSRLLLLHVHGAWRLPEWEDGTEHDWRATDHIGRAVAARYGMEATVLRCVSVTTYDGHETRLYELDNHSAPHDMEPAATWIGRAELALLDVVDDETRALATAWFDRDAGAVSMREAPWARRGWYIEALAWAAARLREVGAVSAGAPEQRLASEQAVQLRFPTDIGTFDFKAVAAPAAHEPALMQWLGGRHPLNFPDVVAVDRDRGWLLQRELPPDGLPLDEVREEEEWYRAVRRLAEVQLDCAGLTRELRALGCPYRGLEVLARRIPRLAAGLDTAVAGERPCGLSAADVQRVAALVPTLLTLCEELASYEIPDSLEHGALRAACIVSSFAGPVYTDWSNSSVSHPFFTMSPLMTSAIPLLPASSRESRRRLRDSYLAAWSDVAPHESLVRAFEIARVLAPVHHASTAHAELVPALGRSWQVACIVPDHLATALRLLGDSESPVSIV